MCSSCVHHTVNCACLSIDAIGLYGPLLSYMYSFFSFVVAIPAGCASRAYHKM